MNLPLKNLPSIPAIAAFLLLAIPLSGHGTERSGQTGPVIEVFTTSHYPIQGNTPHPARNDTGARYTHYEIDRISLLQQALSHRLPNDTAQAKQLVLARFQSMDSALSHQLENAGHGLAQAMHYGIDRVPAVVFDGQAVIYGVTDIADALAHYHQWHERGTR